MAIQLTVKTVAGFEVKKGVSVFCTASYHEASKSSKLVSLDSGLLTFNQTFTWDLFDEFPDEEDILILKVNSRKFEDRVLGSLVIHLSRLTPNTNAAMIEKLTGPDNKTTELKADIDVVWLTSSSSHRPSAASVISQSDTASLNALVNSSRAGFAGSPQASEVGFSTDQQSLIDSPLSPSPSVKKTFGIKRKLRKMGVVKEKKGVKTINANDVRADSLSIAELQREDDLLAQLGLKQRIITDADRALLAPPIYRRRLQRLIDSQNKEYLSLKDYQILITAHECRQLIGANIDPVVTCQLGAERKSTSVKQSTNSPYYNETWKVAMIMGSVRDGRQCDRVCKLLLSRFLKTQPEFVVTVIDPLELDIPLLKKPFHWHKPGETVPEVLTKTAAIIEESDAYVLLSAEYNQCMPPALTNTLDHFAPKSYNRKPTAVVSYSLGGFGGIRMVPQTRCIMAEFGSPVLPNTLSIPKVSGAISETGEAAEESLNERVDKLLADLNWYTKAMRPKEANV